LLTEGGNIWATKHVTAKKALNGINAVFARAVENELLRANPTPSKESMPKVSYKTTNHKAMPFKDVPAFMARLRAVDTYLGEATIPRALEFLILTVLRVGTVAQMRWGEIDWTAPAESMKMGKEHCTPLSDRALEILHEMGAPDMPKDKHVFPWAADLPKSIGHFLCKRMQVPKTTALTHGFRGGFTDWSDAKGFGGNPASRHRGRPRTRLRHCRTAGLSRQGPHVRGSRGGDAALGKLLRRQEQHRRAPGAQGGVIRPTQATTKGGASRCPFLRSPFVGDLAAIGDRAWIVAPSNGGLPLAALAAVPEHVGKLPLCRSR
jgi:integrase